MTVIRKGCPLKVVAIHGIGQTYVGAESLQRDWLPALNDGLAEARALRLDAADFVVVAYGALFRPEGTRAGEPRIEPEELDDWERQLLTEWWREAAALSARSAGAEGDESPEIQPPDFAGRARTPRLVQRALHQLAKSRFFAALGPERTLLFGLRQVRSFLHDPGVKRLALERLAERIAPNTRVLIAHSLGSVVAYEALCANPQWKVDTFVTLGSPLGIPGLVFDVLTPRPQNGRGAWPHVRRWVNVADQGDIVALQKTLAPSFGPVDDRLVHNGWKAHDVTHYLSARTTGEALAAALAADTGP